MYFCAITYQDKKYRFSSQEIDKYIDLASQITNLHSICKDNDIRYDFVHSVSLLLQDGNFFEFIHRSFQEYFFAKFIVNDRKLELENKLDNIDDLFSFEKANLIAMIDDMDHDYFETEFILKKIEKLKDYLKNINAKNEPEKIFKKFCGTLSLTSNFTKKCLNLNFYSFVGDDDEFYREKRINLFILNQYKQYRINKINLSINLSVSDILKIINKYKNFFIRIETNKDDTVIKIIFQLNRELLIELHCSKYAQLIKESLNDYYHDILSRTTKQRSIIDKIIFKNRNL